MCVTAPKPLAESERDPTNSVNFPEDKILLLLLAFDRRNSKILGYLLDKLSYFWSSITLDYLLVQTYNEQVLQFERQEKRLKRKGVKLEKPWREVVQIVLRSKTAHTFYFSMSFKKRKRWLADFVRNLQSQLGGQHPEVLDSYLAELALQPYSGNLLFHLIFEDFTENTQIASRAFKNATCFDFMIYISLHQSER